EALEKEGYEIRYAGVDEFGTIDFKGLEKLVDNDTALVSVMTANNEIGTIEPIMKISKIAHEHGALFHTDAVQAICHIPIDVNDMGIDLLSASGHKFGGPKGIGFLYIRKGIRIQPFMRGGAQEEGKRAGTTNVPGIVGMAKAAELSMEGLDDKMRKVSELRDHAIERIEKEIPYCRLNGHRTERLPGNVNFSYRFVEGESLLMMMNHNGICVSTGSACASGSLDPSHVLLAIGLPHEIAHGSIRM
ncbi:MAG: aminotransferase class V-fold PLP-dependent enzyme, partial [Candidatus Methanomethylophilaceae archaeon]|nr:aminotransferase class V-fold PLP-dependent enzyme [Candidatus Methanomethylophilaceae archaeon]